MEKPGTNPYGGRTAGAPQGVTSEGPGQALKSMETLAGGFTKEGEMQRDRARAALLALAVGAAVVLALPTLSTGQGPVQDATGAVEGAVGGVTGGAPAPAPAPAPTGGTSSGGVPSVSGGYAAPTQAAPPGYQPPLHGTNPHGQGTVATLDTEPSSELPYAGDTAGVPGEEGDPLDVVVGRSRGEQRQDGSYHGKVEVLAIGGQSIVAPTETNEGQTGGSSGSIPADCEPGTGENCVALFNTSSSTDANGSDNSFTAAYANLGGAGGLTVTAAESNGNIHETQNCQRAHGDSTVATAEAGGSVVAEGLHSETTSRECNDGTRSQRNDSFVLQLSGEGVPLPAPGCEDGTADTIALDLSPLLVVECNADDTNGRGEDVQQTSTPYGVREALTVFVGIQEETVGLKLTTAASESHAQAPGDGPPPPPPPPDGECPPDCPPEGNQGAEGRTFRAAGAGPGPAGRPGGPGPQADRLPFTGTDLIGLVMIGLVAVASGSALRRTLRAEPAGAPRAEA